MEINTKIEAILFFKGEAISIKQLAGILGVNEKEIENALGNLQEQLQGRGIRLISNNGKVMLGTAPEVHDVIEAMKKEELSKDLGKASLETLSIVLYKGPVRKSEIDYIRGVNSSTILRSLMIRGLIEREPDKNNQKTFVYYPTLDLISFLGISKLEELPEYEKVKGELEKQEQGENQEQSEQNMI